MSLVGIVQTVDEWSGRNVRKYGQAGFNADSSKVDRGALLSAELRFFPWVNGVYFSLASLTAGDSVYTTVYDKTSRTVGNTTAIAKLEAEVTYKQNSGSALGLGYVGISDSGFSWSFGIILGQFSREKEVNLSVTDSDTTIPESDLETLRQKILKEEKDNDRGYPSLTYFSIGYSFR